MGAFAKAAEAMIAFVSTHIKANVLVSAMHILLVFLLFSSVTYP